MAIGIVEEVEQFSENFLNKEGHVLECEANLKVGQFVDQVYYFERENSLFGGDNPGEQLNGAHELFLGLNRAYTLFHESQGLLLGPPVAILRQLPHPLGNKIEVRLHSKTQLVLKGQQLDFRLCTH